MYAETIDTGATVSVLRAFGPPDVVDLELANGTATGELGAEGFWTVPLAVFAELDAAGGGGTRVPRLTWRTPEDLPVAVVAAAFGVAGGSTSLFTFARDVFPTGSLSAAAILTPIPELVLLPGWTLDLSIAGGQAGDHVVDARCLVQRYQLIPVEDLLEG